MMLQGESSESGHGTAGFKSQGRWFFRPHLGSGRGEAQSCRWILWTEGPLEMWQSYVCPMSETGNQSLNGRAFAQTSGRSVTELKPEYGSTDNCAGTWSSRCQPELKAPGQNRDHCLPVSVEGSLPVHWLPESFPGPGEGAAVLKQGPLLHPCCAPGAPPKGTKWTPGVSSWAGPVG